MNNGAASPFAQFAAFGNNRRRPRRALQRAVRRDGQQFGVGREALLVHRTADRRARLQRHAVRRHVRGTAAHSAPAAGTAGRTCSSATSAPTDHKATTQSQRDADARSSATATSRRRSTDSAGRCTSSIRRPACRSPATPFRASASARRRRRCSATTRGRHASTRAASTTRRRSSRRSGRTASSRGSRRPSISGIRSSGPFGTRERTTDSTNAVRLRRSRLRVVDTDVAVNWNRRFSQFLPLRTRYQFTRQSTTVTPFFANRTNVSGDAGITGNNQEPDQLGAAGAVASRAVAGLSDGSCREQSDVMTHAAGVGDLLDPRPPQLHVRRRRPPASDRHRLAAGSARHVHVHRRRHRLRFRRLPARHADDERRSRSATPTSTSAARRTTPTSPTTGASGRRSR